MMKRRILLKLIDSLLAFERDGTWYVVKIKAGEQLSMYPAAMGLKHIQIHAEIDGNRLVGKKCEEHWTLFDEVVTGKFH